MNKSTTEAPTAGAQSSLSSLQLKRTIGDAVLHARISPCSWMYAGYPLQLTIELANGGVTFVADRKRTYAHATEADVQRLFDTVKTCSCAKCGKPAFDASTCRTNDKGLCEACFAKVLREQFEREAAHEKALLAQRDSKHKSQGFTHRVMAWVHPFHGDDYQVNFWTKAEPTKEMVAKELTKLQSQVLTDYTVTAL